MARFRPSIREWRQPYLLSNLDLVTESLTLIAGKSRLPCSASWYRRCTPVVVSSVTPLMPSETLVHFFGSVSRVLRTSALKTENSSESSSVVGTLAGALPLAALVDQHRGVAAVVEDHVRAVAARPGEDGVGAVPVLLEGLALPGEDGTPAGSSEVPLPTTTAAAASSWVE